MNASPVSGNRSQSLPIRRFWSIRENVSSKIHRLGSALKSGGGNSCQFLPVGLLALLDPRVAGLGGAPNAFRPSPAPSRPSPCRCSRHPATGERVWGTAPSHAPAAALCRRGPSRWPRVDPGLQHQALRIHEQVSLAPLDLLATIIAALFAAHPSGLRRLWLSTIPALDCESRPRRTRALSRRAACSRSQVPSMRQARKWWWMVFHGGKSWGKSRQAQSLRTT